MSAHFLTFGGVALLLLAGICMSGACVADPLPPPATPRNATLSGSTSLSVLDLSNSTAIELKPTSPQRKATGPCAQALEQADTLLHHGQVEPALMRYQSALDQAQTRSDYFAVVHTLTAMQAYRLADVAGHAMASRFPQLGPVWQSWRAAEFPATLPSAQQELTALRQTYRDHQPPLARISIAEPLPPIPTSAGLQQLTQRFEHRQYQQVVSVLSQPAPESHVPAGQWLLAQTLWQQNQPRAAQAALDRALTLAQTAFSPNQQRTFYRQIIDTLLAENWLSPAADLLTRHPALYTATEPQPYELTGRLALTAGKTTQGQALLWQAAFLDPQQPRVWAALASSNQQQSSPDRAELATHTRKSARTLDQTDGLRLVEQAESALANGPPPRVATLNEQSYLRYLLTAEADYQQAVATFYRSLPAQLAQVDVAARQRFVRQAFGSVQHQLTAMASGNPPVSSPACLATRQALLAKAYEQLGILRQLAAEPTLGPDSLPRLQSALKTQARLETALIADLPRLTQLPPMTLYEVKQSAGLTFDREQQAARHMITLTLSPPQGPNSSNSKSKHMN